MRRLVMGVICLAVAVLFANYILTGNIVGSEFAGNTEAEQLCMEGCVAYGCPPEDVDCMVGNQEKCMKECDVQPVALDEGEQCVQDCIDKVCSMGPEYIGCMEENRDSCDDECGMNTGPDESEMGAEELCIFECVAAVDPEIICGNSQQGETGNSVCQECAASCVHLYEGPCLNDEELTEKERACETCEHCYGEPVTGPSGQGWDCIVDVECKDASGEFGDNPEVGEGIVEAVGNFFEGIKDFFTGLFSNEESLE